MTELMDAVKSFRVYADMIGLALAPVAILIAIVCMIVRRK